MPLRLRRLTPDHVDALATLERKLFPPAFHIGAAAFYYHLSATALKGRNYSAGVFDGDKLVGYLLMVHHPSDFFPGAELAYVIEIAVLHRHRREAVPMLFPWMAREMIMSGSDLEGKLRMKTAFPMVVRNWRFLRAFGLRITGMVEIPRVQGERMVNLHVEMVSLRRGPLGPIYRALTAAERARRMLLALPRRATRKLCLALPSMPLPRRLRRFCYLEQPPIEPRPEPVA